MEEFALARDREGQLEKLVPGTEEYYYYHCLHYQHRAQWEKVEEWLKAWAKQRRSSSLREEIERRQQLLRYEEKPQETVEYLRRKLGVSLDHQRAVEGEREDLPSVLDESMLERHQLKRRALRPHAGLRGFRQLALEWLLEEEGEKLNDEQRRDLLQRLQRPDVPSLVSLILQEMSSSSGGGFGSFPLHRLLLLPQLEELARERPSLWEEEEFVFTYLRRFLPDSEVEWEVDQGARLAYLERVWPVVEPLAPTFSSLKAHILYRWLEEERNQGIYKEERFVEYLRIPRHSLLVESDYLQRKEHRGEVARLYEDFAEVTPYAAIGDDSSLIEDFLTHFFARGDDYHPYQPYLRDPSLRRLYATTRMLYGVGDLEECASLLDDPGAYQELQERVEIELRPTNKAYYTIDEPVQLELWVKNVETLVVKVFEINTFNHFLARGKDVEATLDLDGLVAGQEQIHRYKEPPLRRVQRTLDFPELNRPGVYVIEFIGNGKSSRALIRKGALRFWERMGAAGHVFTVIDEQNKPLSDASLWLAGHEYTAGDDGTIVVPYTTQPDTETILLRQGELTSVGTFFHRDEAYSFSAAFHVEREALLADKTAQVLVRPMLQLHGVPLSLELLEEAALVIESLDQQGVSSSKEVSELDWSEEREALVSFRVPPALAQISFRLRARVRSLSQHKKIDLVASRQIKLNSIEESQRIVQFQLSRTAEGVVLYVLGKNGEARPHIPLTVILEHRDIHDSLRTSLQSDEEGRLLLGPLPGVRQLRVRDSAGTEESWSLQDDNSSLPRQICAAVGETIELPYLGRSSSPQRQEFSLLRCRQYDVYIDDCFEALSLSDGFLQIKGLPAGEYKLWLKERGEEISLRVSERQEVAGWLVGKQLLTEWHNPAPLHLSSVEVTEEAVVFHLAHGSESTRLHLFGSRFVPPYNADVLGAFSLRGPGERFLERKPSLYLSGRELGDEYRYILERKYAKKFPGNLLERPGLLLHPWSLRQTGAELEELAEGSAYASPAASAPDYFQDDAKPKRPEKKGGDQDPWNLDFLASSALVQANLTPDEEGRVVLERRLLEGLHQITALALDEESFVLRQVFLPEVPLRRRDLRLLDNLDPEQHLTEKRQISVLQQEETLTIDDPSTASWQEYDSLARVYQLYLTLSGNGTLEEFHFVLRWPELSPDEQRRLYNKYACHELNFFLSRKDPAFFQEVIFPYLQNKRDKTFLDHYLLGHDLAGYLAPWPYSQLNIVERILLAQRMEGEREAGGRHVKDLFDLFPPSTDTEISLFEAALQGSALDVVESPVAAGGPELYDMLGDQPGEPPVPFGGKSGLKAELARGGGEWADDEDLSLEMAEIASYGEVAPEEMEEEPAEKEEAPKLSKRRAAPSAKKKKKADLRMRDEMRSFYQAPESTQEWAENNYYHLTIEEQGPQLVTVNAFWRDYALDDGQGPFLSPHLARATGNFTEMMLALSVLDLPLEAEKVSPRQQGTTLQIQAPRPLLVFHKELKPASLAPSGPPLMVSQRYLRADDRYEYQDGMRLDKYVEGEFLARTVYLCRVVLTNPTSSLQQIDYLAQIPKGALPVEGGFVTRSKQEILSDYSTKDLEYAFYFPEPGDYPHYPFHLAQGEEVLAAAEPVTLHVVRQLSHVDKSSWAYLSQQGEPGQVLDYLRQHNIERLDLEKIAWRMRDHHFFEQTLQLLSRRHVYQHTLWAYSLYHNDKERLAEYLQHCDSWIRGCGLWLESPLLQLHPVTRGWYQHLEYAPLLNARAHRLGKRHKILNERLRRQFQQLVRLLCYKPSLSAEDHLAVTYYLLLQDRLEEALERFERIHPQTLTGGLQYDYLRLYLCFYREDLDEAGAIASRYQDYPVDRWRKLFVSAQEQLDEIAGDASQKTPPDDEDRTARQTALADSSPSLDLSVENKEITLHYQNLKACRLHFYQMDIELLFSRQPFLQQQSEQFSLIRPNLTQEISLDGASRRHSLPLPQKYQRSNVIIEGVAAGLRCSQAYFAHELQLQVSENYGMLRVCDAQNKEALSRVYVKVYARFGDQNVRFYKDGYTDLRGRFDYASLSNDELAGVERFALLVLSEEKGAILREAAPPKR